MTLTIHHSEFLGGAGSTLPLTWMLYIVSELLWFLIGMGLMSSSQLEMKATKIKTSWDVKSRNKA